MFVFCSALGELNDCEVTIPLEGDEIVPVPETNCKDVDEVEEGGLSECLKRRVIEQMHFKHVKKRIH